MEKHDKRTEISQLGEFQLIEKLTKSFIPQNKTTIKAVGDDAAVIDIGNGNCMVMTTDMVVENIHFDLAYAPLKHVGYKAAVVNLSDVYAMNAQPQQITVSIAISNRFSVEALTELYEGVKAACKQYGVDLVGGDTTSSLKGMYISVTAVGQCKRDEVVYRNTACVNDVIVVSGELGGAYLGLQVLEREKEVFLADPNMKPDFLNAEYLVERALKPEARKDIITLFDKENVKPSSMIDISDGLSSEMLHICGQSKVGCLLYDEKIPINPQAYNQAVSFNIDPLNCALSGGDEYELLFTMPPDDFEKIKNKADITAIGAITPISKGRKIMTKGGNIYELQALGWKHF